MAQSSDATAILDDLLTTLEAASSQRREARGVDAIDLVLNGPARRTGVRSLRDAPEVAAFRDALTDSLIRVDTVNRLLQLINTLVTRVV